MVWGSRDTGAAGERGGGYSLPPPMETSMQRRARETAALVMLGAYLRQLLELVVRQLDGGGGNILFQV